MSVRKHDLLDSASQRHGLLARSDVRAAGDADVCRTLVRQGVLEPIGAGALRVVGSPATPRQRVLAACLDVDGWSSHTTSAGLHLGSFRIDDPIHVLVRHGHQSARSTLARVHVTRSLSADDLVEVDGIPVLGVARTLLTLAAMVPDLPESTVVDAVEEAIRLQLASERWLWWTLERLRRPGRNGVAVLERVLSAISGAPVTESWLEREVLRILRAAGLPLPETQARIAPDGAFVARVDFRYPGTRAVIEVNGHRFHASRAQLRRDAARRRRLIEAGYQVYDFTYDEIVETPHLLVEVVARILADSSRAAS